MNGKTPDRSTGQGKHESGERWQIERKHTRKGSLYCIQCLVPNTTTLLCPYNYSQQLEVGADGTSTCSGDPSQEEENDYKRGVKRNKRKGGTPNTPEASGKLLGFCRGQILSVKLGPRWIPWRSSFTHQSSALWPTLYKFIVLGSPRPKNKMWPYKNLSIHNAVVRFIVRKIHTLA